ncbi:helicase domain-containing protein [Coprinopsis cinerea AmutBmut pab1-1]|nr:helicase domain-containing protein [Coprinopsis cinerea AmutBmut pab1-1]
MYHCPNPKCERSFYKPGELQVHRRRCDPKVTVTFGGVQVTLWRTAKGFVCQCDAPRCSKFFGTTQGIQRHATVGAGRWLGTNSVSVDTAESVKPFIPEDHPSQKEEVNTNGGESPLVSENPAGDGKGMETGRLPVIKDKERLGQAKSRKDINSGQEMEGDAPLNLTGDSQGISQLISHPLLTPMGLYIESITKLIACLSCQCLMPIGSVNEHFRQNHRGLRLSLSLDKLSSLSNSLVLASKLPPLWEQPSPVPALKGLAMVADCVRCPYCFQVYQRKSLRVHHHNTHSSQPLENNLPAIYAQRFNGGSHKRLFEVSLPLKPPQATQPEADLFQSVRSLRDAEIGRSPPANVDSRNVSPWLMATKWYLHVEPFETSQLRDLVAAPAKNDGRLGLIKTAVQAWFRHAYDLIPITPELVLQKLNSPNPLGDGFRNQPFKQHFRPETFHEYMQPMEYRPDPLDIPPLLRNIASRPRSIFPHLWGISTLEPTRYSPSSPLYRLSWHSVDIPPLLRNIGQTHPLDIPPLPRNIAPRPHSIFSQFATILTLLALGRYSSTS